MKFHLLFILILFVSFASSLTEQEMQKIKFNAGGEIRYVCKINNQACSTSAVSNLSIYYPNSTILLPSTPATLSGGIFSYTLTPNRTNVMGQYAVYVVIADGVYNSPFSFDYLVTSTANTQTTAQGLGSIAYIILVISITVLLGIAGFRFADSKSKMWIWGLFMVFLSMLFMTYVIWLANEYRIVYVGFDNNNKVQDNFFFIFIWVSIAGLVGAFALVLKNWKEYIRKYKSMITKEESDDGWDEEKEFNIGY